MKFNLEHGFLILYDWLPIVEELSGDNLKELLLALIDKQRNGAPMPRFSDPQCELYFRIIEPTIERRLAGQKGGQETQKRAAGVAATPATTPHSKAKRSRAKQSVAIAERSQAEREEESDVCSEQTVTAPPNEAPPASPLSEEEKEKLISFGIPENYIGQRLSRAVSYAHEQGKPLVTVLLDWWDYDCTHHPPKVGKASPHATSPPRAGEIPFDCRSFDTDDFFQAALKKTFSERQEIVPDDI